MPTSAYSLLFPLRNTLFHGNCSSSLDISQGLPAQLISWQSSVSEQIIVHPEGLLLYLLPDQKLVSIRGMPSIRTWGNPSNWEELVLFWLTHSQPYIIYSQGGLLRQLPQGPPIFRGYAPSHLPLLTQLRKPDHPFFLFSVVHTLLNSVPPDDPSKRNTIF